MGIKENIGGRIREEREKKNLSREQLCGIEDRLSVRQLVRIELGQCLPTLEKLEYIAETLAVDLKILLTGEDISIPDEYFQLKYQLIKSPSYGDSDRITQKTKIFEEIYEKYFNILPEDELLTLDLLERLNEYASGKGILAVQEVYDDLFKQLLTKKKFSLNDLLLAYYYFRQCEKMSCKTVEFTTLLEKTIEQSVSADDLYNYELLGGLSAIASAYASHSDYHDMKKITDKMHEVIDKTLMQFARPVTLMLEAKYSIYVEKDERRAVDLYDSAITLAKDSGDKVLERNLIHERERDFL